MGCEALWLCSAQAALPTATHRHAINPARLPKTILSCCIGNVNTSRNRCWYNPERQRKPQQPEIFRRWIQADSPPSSDSGESLMVVSYNILGDDNATRHRDMYLHVPSHFMEWDRRRRIICQELGELNPGVVCLQEVDKYGDVSSELHGKGYVGSFKRRTGNKMDGCAIFWKENLFRLLEDESIEFKWFGLRDNVAQLFVFEMSKGDSRRLVIGNIHALFSPNHGEIKLGQIRLLLRKAHALSEKWGEVPIVLAGDFNSTPQSPIYEFLSMSELNIMKYDRRQLSGQNARQPAQFTGIQRQMRRPYIYRFLKHSWTDDEVKIASGSLECPKLKHPLKLHSSYATVRGNVRTRDFQGEPLATTYHSRFIGTVDYLWYSDGLTPMRVLDTVPVDILRKAGLPSKKSGSDHLPLACEFGFVRGSGKRKNRATQTTAATQEEKDNIVGTD